MKGYPVFLIGLDRRRCVVVGGDGEAQRKVEGLLECDARVTVIAARATDRIHALAALDELTWLERDYRSGDLEGALLVIVAEREPQLRARIRDDARAAGALVNVMDDAEHCDFIAGSVVRRGALTVAISTSGSAPAMAVRLRQRLERELGPELGEFLELMASVRDRVARRHSDFRRRRALWYRLVDSDVLEHLRQGRREVALERLESLLAAEPPDAA